MGFPVGDAIESRLYRMAGYELWTVHCQCCQKKAFLQKHLPLQIIKQKWFLGMLGLMAAAGMVWMVPGNQYPLAQWHAGLVTLMAWFWVFEVIPIPVTSLFPLFLMPALGLGKMDEVAAYYGESIIFLFLGGFLLAIGLQKSGLHKRLALAIVAKIGGQPARLVLGFMVATGLMSMWISNTASVMVMMPIALSVIDAASGEGADRKQVRKLALGLMLGIAYAADIGGMSTLVGTPPNLIFLRTFSKLFPAAPEVGFGQWMAFGVPIGILFLGFGWLLMTKVILRMGKADLFGGGQIIHEHQKELGPVRWDEWWSGIIFGVAVLLWVTGSDIKNGEEMLFMGWRTLLGLGAVSDPAVAIFAATLLFVIPSKSRKGEAILAWKDATLVPWGILLLFGGGFAIAGGFESTKLSIIIQDSLSGLEFGSPLLVVAFTCFLITFLTEITSNSALVTLMLPILASLAVVMRIDPRLFLIPATLTASCAFMMPIASPTQAIIFGSGHVEIKEMMRAGIWFNFLGIIIVTALFMTIGKAVLGIDLTAPPAWLPPVPTP